MLKKKPVFIVSTAVFAIFLLVSLCAGYRPGRDIGSIFLSFFIQMIRILPCVFILIGLFDVWVRTETVEKYLGRESGFLSYIWAILLAGTSVGGMHVSLPVAHALIVKKARLGVVLAFISCAGICRILMTLFEASFLGWPFTLVRFAVSLPLVILFSSLLGKWFERSGYTLPDMEEHE